MVPPSPKVLRFGLFEADLTTAELRKRGRKIPLQDQPFRVLTLLLQHAGELVTREEFQRALWSADTFVEFDEGLNKAIQKLRQALDDSSNNPRFIETLARKGYRFIAPVEGFANRASVTANQESAKRERRHILAWALLALVSVGLLARVRFQFLRSASHQLPRTVPLTSFPGRQITPAVSPDGKQVAFAWDGNKGDNFDIYVKLVGAGEPLKLTSNPAAESWPTWSPDGNHIAFCRELPDHVEIWTIPALGGAERKVGESESCEGLSWSPKGQFLALGHRCAPRTVSGVSLLSIETSEARELTSPSPGFCDCRPAFSPNGDMLAFVRAPSSESSEIYELPVRPDGRPGGGPRRVTYDERNINGFDWDADGRRIIYSSGMPGAMNLWIIPAFGGTSERLSVAGENASAVSVARSGVRLVYERYLVDTNIWRVPGPNSLVKRRAPERFIASTRTDEEPQFSPNGGRIVFVSARSGNDEIWVCDREGRNPVQLTSFAGPSAGSPRWSPDGRWIAFDCPKAGNWDIFVISADGGLPRSVTAGPTNNMRPSWSRDGRWIYFGSVRSGEHQIWKVPAQGGAAVQVTKTRGGLEAVESPDGKFVYYAKRDAPGIWRVPIEGGEEIQVLEQVEHSHWALTREGICFFDLSNRGGPTLRLFRFATGKTTLFREFPKGTTIDRGDEAISVSPDGGWIIYTQVDQAFSDLMLVENFR